MEKGEIILYQPDNSVQLEVRMESETVWLTQAQMAELFQKDRTVITRHINNVFTEKELEKESNVHFLHIPFSAITASIRLLMLRSETTSMVDF